MKHLILTLSIVFIVFIVIHTMFLIIVNFKLDFIVEKTSDFVSYKIVQNFKNEIEKVESSKTFKVAKSLVGDKIQNINEKIDSFALAVSTEIPIIIEELKSNNWNIEISEMDHLETVRAFIDYSYMRHWIRYKYINILRKLKEELNIFLSTNLIIFLLICFVNFKKEQPEITRKLSLLVILSVITASFIYIFNQNWFYAIIFNAYFGYSYSFIILVILGLLIDITFNKGRIIKRISIP